MNSVSKIFKQYIKGTPEKAIVPELTLCFCELTRLVMKAGNFPTHKVYITTKVIKHLYDSKPAEEFEAVMKNMEAIVSFPEYIYQDKEGKRGEICLVKTIKGFKYLCSIEKTDENDPDDGKKGMNYVVTAFRLRKENYLNSYKLLWSWKGDVPSS
jgi:hypothetical protein